MLLLQTVERGKSVAEIYKDIRRNSGSEVIFSENTE
jgi:hypothetical protein